MGVHRVEYEVAGCTFTHALTQVNWTSEMLLAEDGITVLGTKYDINISGVIAGSSITDLQTKLYQARNILTKPRGNLLIAWAEDGTTNWKNILSFSEDESIDFGPMPGQLRIDNITGGLCALYSWQVSATVKECYPQCSVAPNKPGTMAGQGILALSRTHRHSVNSSGLTTRVVSGRLTLNSSEVALRRPGDYYRRVVEPVLPSNFQRESAEFTQSTDGRYLDFSVVDVEVLWTAPKPILDPRSHYSCSLRGEGGMADFTLTGSFKAPANVSKQTILQKVGDLLFSRLPDREYLWHRRAVTESVYENEVSFDFAWSASGQAGESDDLLMFEKFGLKPPGSSGNAQEIGVYGGDGTKFDSGVMAGPPKLFYDACNPTPLAEVKPKGSSSSTAGGTSLTKPRTNKNTPSMPGTGNLSASHTLAPFTEYHERYSWEGDNQLEAFYPKAVGAPPVIQQVGNPILRMIQTGYLTREGPLGTKIEAAKPYYEQSKNKGSSSGGPIALVKEWSISPTNMVPLAIAGQYRFSVTWQYVFLFTINPTAASGFQFPSDPRVRESEKPPFLPEVPGLVIVPDPDAES